jgi:2-oxoglutarate ferredoxin oxidoreductase subunit alpha
MTIEAVKDFGLTRKDATRAKNMFALGLLTWLYHRPTDGTINFLSTKFASKPEIRDANITAFKAGYAFGETTEVFAVTYQVAPAPMPAGKYRQISGNLALAYGLITASRKAGLPLFLGAYPITPASDVLHELSKHKRFGVTTFQAEDYLGARRGVEVRDHRASRSHRAALDHLRHPARWTEHRNADQDRAGGLATGNVRPQWRGTCSGARSPVPR